MTRKVSFYSVMGGNAFFLFLFVKLMLESMRLISLNVFGVVLFCVLMNMCLMFFEDKI